MFLTENTRWIVARAMVALVWLFAGVVGYDIGTDIGTIYFRG